VHARVESPATGVLDIGGVRFATAVLATNEIGSLPLFGWVRAVLVFAADCSKTSFTLLYLSGILFYRRLPEFVDVSGGFHDQFVQILQHSLDGFDGGQKTEQQQAEEDDGRRHVNRLGFDAVGGN